MSGEALRRAAALMRARAEAVAPWPWDPVEGASGQWWVEHPYTAEHPTADIALDLDEGHAEHIASWHPVVAFAVADWLDDHAETAELFVAKEIPASVWSMNWQTSHNHALAVAHAYLDTDPSP